MLSFKQLIEKRKNPESNQKVSAIDQLISYSDQDDIYISFTTVEKIGINPRSTFVTPLGVYAYPLKASFKKYGVKPGSNDDLSDLFPFAGNAPFIQVLRAKHSRGFLDNSNNNYTTSNFVKDVKRLQEILSDNSSEVFEIAGESSKNAKTPLERLWYLTYRMSNVPYLKINGKKSGSHPGTIWNTLLRELGYTGVSDSAGAGFIHLNEPVQTVFLDVREFKHIDSILNKRYDARRPEVIARGEEYTSDWQPKKGSKFEGIFKGENWHSGKFEGSLMDKPFNFYSGQFVSGVLNTTPMTIWHDGLFRGERWNGPGTWKNGIWANGIFDGGKWLDGLWKGGEWKSGSWKDGEILSTKFKVTIPSSKNPTEFKKIEDQATTVHELKNLVA